MNENIRYVIHGISGLTGRPEYVKNYNKDSVIGTSANFSVMYFDHAPGFTYDEAKNIVKHLAELRFTKPYPQFGLRTCKKLIKDRTKMFGGKYGFGIPLKGEQAYINAVSRFSNSKGTSFWNPINVFSVIPVEIDKLERKGKMFRPIGYKIFQESGTEEELSVQKIDLMGRKIFKKTDEMYGWPRK